MTYGAYNFNPCMYDDREAWVLPNQQDGWQRFDVNEIMGSANFQPMTEDEYKNMFRFLPALPREAFYRS